MTNFRQIPADILEEIKVKNDIVEVVEQYVNLTKKTGANFFGLCPFHNEKTPSFSVSPSKQMFYCFGCHKGGNVINFIQEIETIPYYQAAQILAERANVRLPKTGDAEQQQRDHLKKRLVMANTEAARHFYLNLRSSKGRQAVSYLKERGISGHTIVTFGLGYATEGWQDLYDHLVYQGYSDDELRLTGLFRENKHGKPYDLFRGRLMFPIIDTMGRIIAFGGRSLDDSMPKYINSPETPIYSKGQILYGLNLAKRTKAREIILVEGYMDVLSLHQAGFDQVVGVLGTALTENQVRLLRRYKDRVIVGFDADEAGQQAALRSFELLERQNFHVSVLVIPDGKDPDDYVRAYGSDRFKAVLDRAMGLLDFQFEQVRMKHTVDGVFDDVGYMDDVCALLDSIRSPVQFDRYVDKVAQTLGNVRVDSVRREVERWRRSGGKKKKHSNQERKFTPRPQQNGDFKEGVIDIETTQISNDELTFLALLAEHKELYEKLDFVPIYYEFIDAREDGFPAQVLHLAQSGELASSSLMEIAANFKVGEEGLKDKIAKLYMTLPEQYVFSKIVEDGNRLAERIRLDYLQMRRDWLNRQLDAVRHEEDFDLNHDIQVLKQERNDISRRIINLRRKIESKRVHRLGE